MPPNLCPPERAIGISRQERDGVRKISLPSQENLEWRLLRRDDGASFGVVADALTTGEPRLSRRRRARVDGRVGNCAIEIWHIRFPVLVGLFPSTFILRPSRFCSCSLTSRATSPTTRDVTGVRGARDRPVSAQAERLRSARWAARN